MSGLLPMLFVDDVEGSSRWYQQLFGFTSGHGGPEFEMLMSGDRIVLQLHRADLEEHGTRVPAGSERGVGVLLYFQTDDIDGRHRAALDMGARVEGEPVWIPEAHHDEFVVRDPDGYAVAVHTAFDPTR